MQLLTITDDIRKQILGIAKPFLTQNWLTVQDVTNLLELENYK